MLSMSDAAKDLMKKMEGSVLAFSKKKSFSRKEQK